MSSGCVSPLEERLAGWFVWIQVFPAERFGDSEAVLMLRLMGNSHGWQPDEQIHINPSLLYNAGFLLLALRSFSPSGMLTHHLSSIKIIQMSFRQRSDICDRAHSSASGERVVLVHRHVKFGFLNYSMSHFMKSFLFFFTARHNFYHILVSRL